MRRLRKISACALLALLWAATGGCGASNRAAVTGEVTLDGRAVEDGAINFIPIEGQASPSAWADIKAGNYSIPAKRGPGLGTNRVEVRWVRKTGKMIPGTTEAETVEAIPIRYNSQSTLKAEIKPGNNQVDLKLHSK